MLMRRTPKRYRGNERFSLRGGKIVDAHQRRDVRAVDVGVQEAHGGAGLRQRHREVDATVDLPTPPLPLPTATMVLMGSLIFSWMRLSARTRAVEGDLHLAHAGNELPDGLLAFRADLVLQGTGRAW